MKKGNYPFNVIEEIIESNSYSCEYEFSKESILIVIDEYLMGIEKQVIQLRFDDKLSLKKCGEDLGLSPVKIKGIEAKALRKLKIGLRRMAIDTCIENLCEEPKEEIDSIDTDINYVADNLDSDDLFLQMAEEAAELSQACLKYVRAHKGNNPTKDSEDVYLKGIIEEFTDVQVCAEAIDITTDSDIHDSKIHRWADRIRKKNGGSAK